MSGVTLLHGLPLALLADHRETRSQWLVRLLEDAGYGVLREQSGRNASERVSAAPPDLIVIASVLPDMDGIELCRALRAGGGISRSTPIFVTFGEAATREQRLAALRAGAWECLAPPHDTEEILLKANAYVGAKREADRARSEGLLDPATGLYNRQGLARRARELGSQAVREHAALGCVVLAVDIAAGPAGARGDDVARAVACWVSALNAEARLSDVLGRLGATEFAVLAPGTNAAGARRLAERLSAIIEANAGPAPEGGEPTRPFATRPVVQVRCGYDAVANMGYAPIEPIELLTRASAALRTGRAEGRGPIRGYE
jgi:diguanylate cyclase (GGDEF)-like protein